MTVLCSFSRDLDVPSFLNVYRRRKNEHFFLNRSYYKQSEQEDSTFFSDCSGRHHDVTKRSSLDKAKIVIFANVVKTFLNNSIIF